MITFMGHPKGLSYALYLRSVTFSEDEVTTIEPTITDDVENPIVLQQIENNQDNEYQLVDSLEDVINDLNELYHDITLNDSINYDYEYVTDYEDIITTELTTTRKEIEVTNNNKTTDAEAELTTDSVMTPEQEQKKEEEQEEALEEALELLQLQSSNNLTQADMEVLTALLELEKLRGEQRSMMELIESKVNQLENLLETNSSLPTETQQIRLPKFNQQKPRDGKTLDDNFVDDKTEVVEASLSLFENLQAQLLTLLNARHQFLQDISLKINRELGVFQQTVSFLERLVNFKLDQGRYKYSNRSIKQ